MNDAGLNMVSYLFSVLSSGLDFRGSTQIDDGANIELLQLGKVRIRQRVELTRAIDQAPLYGSAIGGGVSAQIAEICLSVELHQPFVLFNFRALVFSLPGQTGEGRSPQHK